MQMICMYFYSVPCLKKTSNHSILKMEDILDSIWDVTVKKKQKNKTESYGGFYGCQ